ncbi:class I SAM-dependent methyltransferase [Niastella sp. OAS944]|uniref:class I SAM-dependent methyltransferase n=1 Tax=Niastella sp. OAS944 TaxID=2664089 RepID=UPI003473C190|nr:ubiquinone/menaquinone biosynthesis C-methylase UbiE [Chitinophagaceae bacterium OAS944]
MNKASTFDVLAGGYNAGFVESLTGSAQRRTTYKWLRPMLANKPNMQLLEINCGTGADAFWMAQKGHTVTATDASPAMIEQAQRKAVLTPAPNQPVFQTCAFDQLQTTFSGRQFDGIVSNFAGLNCVSPMAMTGLAKQFYQLLKPGGQFAVVLFGKCCLWETMYYLLKAQPRQAFRRWTNKKVMVPLTAQVQQPVYYYSIKAFTKLMAPLQFIEKKPVGLCIPPSWMEGHMQQHRRFYQTLVQWEEKTGHLSFATSLADHAFLLFKKEEQ